MAARGTAHRECGSEYDAGEILLFPSAEELRTRRVWRGICGDALLAACKDARGQDVVATATALTVESILDAYRRFCWLRLGQTAPLAKATEMFVAGGGAKNKTLMRWLREGFAELGVSLVTTAEAGLAIEAKEAAAFALLGWLTWHGLPGNVPSATGASRARRAGQGVARHEASRLACDGCFPAGTGCLPCVRMIPTR